MKKVTLKSIEEARSVIKDVIRETPLIHCPTLFESLGNEIYFKMENLQKTGSFKLRGALNKIYNMTEDEKKHGIIASSAGNHAQGVALGAKAAKIKAVIVMPSTAPMSKVEATKSYGAEVVLHGDVYDDAYNKACEIQKETGATFVHPFNDPDVISGQGTIGLEILEQLPDVDIVVVPIGGGGLLSGIVTAIKAKKPTITVIGVQTANLPSMKEALKAKHPVDVEKNSTIADGIAVRKAGELTYGIISELVDEIVTVTEDEIVNAILFLLEKNKVLAEGAGAVSLAAILAGKIEAKDKKICSVISGGNIDITTLNKIVKKGLINLGRQYQFTTKIPDKQGELAQILEIIKEKNANISFLNYSILKDETFDNMQEIEIILECKNIEHKNEIKNSLEKFGYKLY